MYTLWMTFYNLSGKITLNYNNKKYYFVSGRTDLAIDACDTEKILKYNSHIQSDTNRDMRAII